MQPTTHPPDWVGLIDALIALVSAITVAVTAYNHLRLNKVQGRQNERIIRETDPGSGGGGQSTLAPVEPPIASGDTQPLVKRLPPP